MKKIFGIGLFAIFFGSFTYLHAQDTTSLGKKIEKGVNKTGSAIGKGAKKVGAKTSEIASKGKAGVVDKVYKGKEGLEGQKIYIDKNSKYYWIDKKGHRQFVTKAQIKDKKS